MFFEEAEFWEEAVREYRELLFKKRILILNGNITEDKISALKGVLLILAAQSSEEITLSIDSRGGEVGPALRFYDAIKVSPAPVIGIVNGNAQSAALIVLQACQQRKATRHSRFYLHPMIKSICFGSDKEIKKALREAKELQAEIRQILAARTGRTIEEIAKKEREAREMGAEKAKEFGLVDEVIGT